MVKMTQFRSLVISLFFIFAALPAYSDVTVFDANNKYLGVLLYPGYESEMPTIIYIPPFGTAQITKDSAQNGVLSVRVSSASYESTDCSGTPYADTLSMAFNYPSIQQLGGRYFVLNVKGLKKTFTPKSSLSSAGCVAITGGTTSSRNPLLEISSTLLPFPFTYPVHFEYTPGDINGDGKIGLEEALVALQVSAGLRNLFIGSGSGNQALGVTLYSISGNINNGSTGINGVTVNLTGTSSAIATTGSSGNYSFTGLANGSYTLAPSHANGTFIPESTAVVINSAYVTGQNFTFVYDPTNGVQHTSPTAAVAVASSLTKLEAQTTKDLASALTVLSMSDRAALAQASNALSAAQYAQMAGYLAAGSNLASYRIAAGSNQPLARSAEITAWIATLSTAGQAAVNTLFSNVASDATKVATVKILFTGATTAEIPAIQSMLKAAVKTDGSVDTGIFSAIVNLLQTIGTGDLVTIAAAQADALRALLTAQNPGATVTVAVVNQGNNVWTMLVNIK